VANGTADAAFDMVAATFRHVCQHPLPELSPDTYLDELPGMDSLRVLHLIAAWEDQLGVDIDVAALDRLYQVRDVLDAVLAAKE
jgi:acyl carrier protein